MKIKINKNPAGQHKCGDEVEAVEDPMNDNFWCFDNIGTLHCYLGTDVEKIFENKISVQSSVISLRDLLGQDLSGVTFK